jgi:rod shape determining protein RodA
MAHSDPLTALVLFGATVLWSAAGGNWSPYAWKHIFNFGLFLSLAIGISRLPEHTFRKAAYPIYGGLVFLLMLVEAVGKVGGGSQRWLNIGFMNLQPSELMKPGIVLVMALFYATLPPTLIRSWRIGAALAVAGHAGGVGDAATGSWHRSCHLFRGGGRGVLVRHAHLVVFERRSGGGGCGSTRLLFALHDYQRKRVLVFMDPEADMLGSGYHITQSKIAIGSGGFFGKGLGNGTQSHLKYLPEAHTDFAFATMAEEWGMIGAVHPLRVLCRAVPLGHGRIAPRA